MSLIVKGSFQWHRAMNNPGVSFTNRRKSDVPKGIKGDTYLLRYKKWVENMVNYFNVGSTQSVGLACIQNEMKMMHSILHKKSIVEN